MECIHCGAPGHEGYGEVLSTREIMVIVEDLAALGVKRFLATGGEPLVRPDMLDVLQIANDCGRETGFSTNGLAGSAENIGRIVRVADSIQVSVDGTAKTHDEIRKTPGAFSGAIHALRLLKDHGCRQSCMTTIVSPLNLYEIGDLYRIAKESADLWRVGAVMPVGRAAGNAALFLSDGQLRSLLDFLAGKMGDGFPVLVGENLGWLGPDYDRKIHRQDFFFCGAGTISCCIGADGRVRGCPELPAEEEYIAGDLRKETFTGIWERGQFSCRNNGFPPISMECRKCTELDLCRGGCQVMRLGDMHCTKKRVENTGS
ncbi:radical SAM/SPASM domain-containing protein [Methanoregula sp.]|uniref:radical SAM/SPASM domain-containing protein n=1 Tax=Methanoregula sp. TaxID=2052170 RepID=UPI000CC4D880|nr:radical SAM protein [Methanoregula sp.]PKG31930.1 MAG: hypothetical protein CW742_10805 [Methanoregula sp.]